MAGDSSHGQHDSAAFAASFALRARMNHESITAFALAMTCVAGVCIIFHLLRATGRRIGLEPRMAKHPYLPVRISRIVRSALLRKALGLPSVGHVVIILLYVIINIVITFTNNDNQNMTPHANIASRTGWLAMGNLLLLIFLALKNTPLAFLTAWSYERLNILHQIAGYATVIFVIVHACTYASYFAQQGRLSRLTEIEEIFGIVAGFAFFILALAGAFVRRWSYELFYYIHISFWMLSIVVTGLHQPEFSKKIIFMTCVAGGIWGLDRLIRLTRLVVYSSNNSIVLTPLPHGGTRVTLKKPPLGAVSGKHCFIWIPGVRAAETHPFTIAAMDPLEFVVASYDGFTCDLHKYAVQHPGVSLRASVEGSYGTFPDPMDHDNVVLVAGGSGASFTFGTALNMLKRMKGNGTKSIVFIWLMKHHAYTTWFADHLQTLQADPKTSIQLYVTRTPPVEVSSSSSPPSSPILSSPISDPGKSSSVLPKLSIPDTLPTEIEKALSPTSPAPSDIDGSPAVPVTYERPDVAALIQGAIEETPTDRRVLVMGCGPERLMNVVRDTTAECIKTKGPGVELHCEQFGW